SDEGFPAVGDARPGDGRLVRLHQFLERVSSRPNPHESRDVVHRADPALGRGQMSDLVGDAIEPGEERPAHGALTIRDLARLAGVSIGTASKALNANGRLSAETRAKVLKVAKDIGYRPNGLAQSLHRARSMTVGILSNDSFGRFTFPIVEALERRLSDQGIAVF